MDRGTRWFRRLLRLLPADFQADYARDMERTFRTQQREAREEGARGLTRLWLETFADLLCTAPRQHLDHIRQDVRYAVRTIARRPAFSAVTALVLAIGIGGTTAAFSIVDAALFRPIPFDAAGRLVSIREQTPQDRTPWELSYPSFLELRHGATSFEQVAAYMRNGVVVGGPEPMLTNAAFVSANLLDTLRARPIAGRAFDEREDAPGGAAVALIGHDLARARFGSAEEAVGRSLTIADRPTTVVGVLSEPRYFTTLRIPLLRGRLFTEQDVETSPPVAIINRAAAQQVFGDVDPIGQRIMLGGADGPKREIVGVVDDIRHRGLGESVMLQAYIPLTQFYGGPVWLVQRTAEHAAAAEARIRAAARAIDRTQAVNDVRTFHAVLADTLAQRRFLLWLIAAFAAAALLLAVTGLYGVVSYVVVQRRRDIGLRMALGAAHADIRRLVLRIGMAPVAAGLTRGLLLVAVATRPIEAMLFSAPRFDVATLAAAAGVLFASALVACYLPARRAMRVDPSTALRAD